MEFITVTGARENNLHDVSVRVPKRNITAIVVEHNLDVIAHADWVIDLGPDGGDDGGAVVFEGPPRELVAASGSFTGEHLARQVAATATR